VIRFSCSRSYGAALLIVIGFSKTHTPVLLAFLMFPNRSPYP